MVFDDDAQRPAAGGTMMANAIADVTERVGRAAGRLCA
jgi:hypothetical protein